MSGNQLAYPTNRHSRHSYCTFEDYQGMGALWSSMTSIRATMGVIPYVGTWVCLKIGEHPNGWCSLGCPLVLTDCYSLHPGAKLCNVGS